MELDPLGTHVRVALSIFREQGYDFDTAYERALLSLPRAYRDAPEEDRIDRIEWGAVLRDPRVREKYREGYEAARPLTLTAA
jgi:hypothetical protein